MRARTGTGTGTIEFGGELSIEESKEVFANFGLAIHVSNVLEFAVLNALLVTEIVPNIRSFTDQASWEAAYDEFFAKGFSLPFGQLLSRLFALKVMSDDAVEALAACKTVRNHLAHHFMREAAELIYSPKGRQRIIKECESAVALFEIGHDEVERYIERRFDDLGVDKELWNAKIMEGMNQLIKEAAEIDE